MDLRIVRTGKRLCWPAPLTPDHPTKKFTRLGAQNYRLRNRVVRGEGGFVVDLDSPGESFFCGEDIAFLDRVPRDGYPDALETIKAQGPIDFQPALDWLEEQNLASQTARPEPAAAPVTTDADADEVPLEKMRRGALRDECDRLGLPYGKVDAMREAIAEARAAQESSE